MQFNLNTNLVYMNKEDYLAEVETRLFRIFAASKEGHKAALIDKHRLEGFINAGVFMKIASNSELSVLMERTHQSVFGMSIQDRKKKNTRWEESIIDYSSYDLPTYMRNK